MTGEAPATNPKSLIPLADVGSLVEVMRALDKGKEPHQIQVKGYNDVKGTVDLLIGRGLVETLEAVPLLQAEHQPGAYFLTDKGKRWLRTYGRRERWIHALSRWQFIGGIVPGLVISWVATFCTLSLLRFLVPRSRPCAIRSQRYSWSLCCWGPFKRSSTANKVQAALGPELRA